MTADKSAVEALLVRWEAWDGTWPHPDASSPSDREALREAIAADRAAGRLVAPVMDGPSFGDYWPTDDELRARAEQAERELDNWKQSHRIETARLREAQEQRAAAYARGRDEALAEVHEAILAGSTRWHPEVRRGFEKAASIVRELRDGDR